MTAILDTSFLFALTDTNDLNHVRVQQVAQTLSEPLLLPISVLPEICYLLASRIGHVAMRQFVEELSVGDTKLESPTRDDLKRASAILNQYADSKLDFVDATLVAIAERHNITHILTLDRRDYLMIRPTHCAFFEILP